MDWFRRLFVSQSPIQPIKETHMALPNGWSYTDSTNTTATDPADGSTVTGNALAVLSSLVDKSNIDDATITDLHNQITALQNASNPNMSLQAEIDALKTEIAAHEASDAAEHTKIEAELAADETELHSVEDELHKDETELSDHEAHDLKEHQDMAADFAKLATDAAE